METTALILLIIVSATLTVFLIALIVLIVLAIRLMKQLKMIANQAEKAVDTVAAAGDVLKNVSGPLAIVKLLRNLMKQHKTKDDGKKKK